MSNTAASVNAKIVKAGGAGIPDYENMDCKAIYAMFDPPIVTGTYSQVRAANSAAANGCQAEHRIPNGCFQGSRGNSGTNVDGVGNYSDESAFCFNAYDDQSQGTEHKFLTDAERQFSQENGAAGNKATLDEWSNKMQDENSKMLASEDAHSNTAKGARDRIKDGKNMSPEQRKALADKAAKCIKEESDKHYAGIKGDTPLNNPWKPTKDQLSANESPETEVEV